MDGLAHSPRPDALRPLRGPSASLSLWRLLRPHLTRVSLGLLCSALVAAAGAAYAYLSGPLLHLLLGAGGVPSLGPFRALLPPTVLAAPPQRALIAVAVLLVILAVVKGLAQLAQTALLAGAVADVGRRLRIRTFSHLLRLPLSAHRRLAPGELLARLLDDVTRVQQATVEAPLAMMREGLAALALLAVAFGIAPQLALLAIVVLPLVGLVVSVVSGRVKRSAARGQEALGALAARAERGLNSIREVKSCRAEAREAELVATQANAAARWALGQQLARAISPLFNEVSAAVALGAVLVYAGSLVARGSLSGTLLLSFFTAVLLLYKPIKGLSNAFSTMAAGQASVDRVAALLASPPEADDGGEPLAPLAEKLELQSVGFAYEEAAWVLRDLDLTLVPGQIVGITGPSGAGKSTLLDLLAGLEVPSEGQLLWDGEELGVARRGALRAQVALVPQQPLLFDGSVADNLRYGAPEADEAALWEALTEAGLEQRCRRLALGLQTLLGVEGGGLSVGEVQRLALARALLRSTRVLLLDEPSAALDDVAEAHLAETLEGLRSGRTIVLISHRRALLDCADRCFELRDGRLRPWSLQARAD